MVVATDLYCEVTQFYAAQMQALDRQDFAYYAETFTDNGVFRHSPHLPPARTPRGIAQELEDFHRRRFGDQPVWRRHWFNHLQLAPQSDGTIRATCYALVITTRSGSPPEVAPSCVVHDVLTRVEGQLKLQSRQVDHDGAPVGSVR